MWDPEQYLKFESERARPFFELVNAIDHPRPLRVADLGCGNGIFATGAKLMGATEVFGVDIDKAAIDSALENARSLSLEIDFEQADIAASMIGR